MAAGTPTRLAGRPLRLALVLPYNPLLERSGLQNLACRLASTLTRDGMDAWIVSLGPSGIRDGARVRGVPTFGALIRTLAREDWDVVHWLEVWPDARKVIVQHLASLAGRRRCRQVLTTETIGNLTARGGGTVGMLLCRRAYHSYVVSSVAFLAEYMRAGINRGRVLVVPHGLDPAEPFRPLHETARREVKQSLGFDPDLKLVLYLGRLVERKRPLDFVSAVQRLLAIRNDLEAAVVGESYHHEDSIDELAHRTIDQFGSPRLTWRPQTEQPWLYFAVADLAVTPSDRDGEAFTVLEAMACGAVPVVSSLPVLEGIVGGHVPAGAVFPVGDVDRLTQVVQRLLDDDRERARLRANALQRVVTERNLRIICRETLMRAYRSSEPLTSQDAGL